MTKSPGSNLIHPTGWLLSALCAATLLSACGGGSSGGTQDSAASGATATAATTLQMDVVALPADVAAQSALPSFHVAPALLKLQVSRGF